MQFRIHYLCQADALGDAEFLVLQHRHTSGTYRFKRAQLQRVQRSLSDVKCGKVLHELPPADRFQVAEVVQVAKFRGRRLDFEEFRDFLKGSRRFFLFCRHYRRKSCGKPVAGKEKVANSRENSFRRCNTQKSDRE